MADTTPTSSKLLTITPSTADLTTATVCRFKIDPPETKVVWSIKPEQCGEIDSNGVYLSPKPNEAKYPQTVIVIANEVGGEMRSAIASVAITDAPTRILWLGWYGIALAALLGLALLIGWNHLYRKQTSPLVVVNPQLVTLDPTATTDESFAFTAVVVGEAKNSVTWWVEGGGDIDANGLFHPKRDKDAVYPQEVRVYARSVTDPTRVGSAIVRLVAGKHFEIVPGPMFVFPSQEVPFRAIPRPAPSGSTAPPTPPPPKPGATSTPETAKQEAASPSSSVVWSVTRGDLASISKSGIFRADAPREGIGVVEVVAKDSALDERAAAAVVITAPFGSTDFGNWTLILFVIVCGAIGSMIYYASSFVAYVGNQTFRSSWTWFFISRPFVGSALAVVFFFLVGSGLVTGATVNDLMKLGLISALVGLFSDKAVKKLSDVLDVLLATKEDRKDPVDQTKPAAPSATATPPTISATAPPIIDKGKQTTVEVRGRNFKAGFKVTVNGQHVIATQPSDQSFKVEIPAAQATPPIVKIGVITDQGTGTWDLPVNDPFSPQGGPLIDKADPDSLEQGKAATVLFTGVNFKSGFAVTVDGTNANPKESSETSFKLEITAEQAKGTEVKVKVTTDQGSNEKILKVNQPGGPDGGQGKPQPKLGDATKQGDTAKQDNTVKHGDATETVKTGDTGKPGEAAKAPELPKAPESPKAPELPKSENTPLPGEGTKPDSH